MNKLTKEVANLIKSAIIITLLLIAANSRGWINLNFNGNMVANDLQRVKNLIRTGLDQEKLNPNIRPSRHINNPLEYHSLYVEHTLQPGETLRTLEDIYGVPWQEIQQFNGIRNARRVRPGQNILIPLNKETKHVIM